MRRLVALLLMAAALAACVQHQSRSPAVSGSYLAETPRATATTTASTAAGIDPTVAPYSCAGNDTTNDLACLQKAITAAAAAGQKVLLGGHIFAVAGTLSVTASVEGPGGINQQTTGIDTLVVSNTAQGTRLSGFTCYAPAGSTVGACIHDDGAWTEIDHVETVNGCIGIDDDDAWAGRYSHVYVWFGSIAPGCRGIVFGRNALTQGTRLEDYEVGMPAGVANTYAVELVDVGGAWLLQGDALGGGTLVDPGSGQAVTWTEIHGGTAMGDTLPGSAITVMPAAGGIVAGLMLSAWAGQAGYCVGQAGCPASGLNNVPGIDIDASAGSIRGVHLQGQRIMSGGGQGVYAIGPNLSGLTIDAAVICGNAGPAIELGPGVSAAIRDNSLRGPETVAGVTTGCDYGGSASTQPAVKLDGDNVVLYTGNDMTGSQGVVGIPAVGSVTSPNLGP
jgi:hypothetical protein